MTMTDTPRELERFDADIRRRRRRTVISGLTAAAAIVGIAAYLGIGSTGSSAQKKTPHEVTSVPPAPTVPQQSVDPANAIAPAEKVTKLPINSTGREVSGGLASGELGFALGQVWVLGQGQHGSIVERVSADGSRLLSTTPLGAGVGGDLPILQAGHYVVVSASSKQLPAASGLATLDRYVVLDSNGVLVRTVHVTVAGAGTGDATGAWVETDNGTIGRLDPSSGRITHTTTLPNGAGVLDMAQGLGALWVVDNNNAALLELDPSTGAVRHTARLGADPAFGIGALHVGEGAVYVSLSGGGIERFDAKTLAVTAVLRAYTHSDVAFAIDTTGGPIWVKLDKGVVALLNPTTLAVERNVQLYPALRNNGTAPLTLSAHRLYDIDADTSTLDSIPI